MMAKLSSFYCLDCMLSFFLELEKVTSVHVALQLANDERLLLGCARKNFRKKKNKTCVIELHTITNYGSWKKVKI